MRKKWKHPFYKGSENRGALKIIMNYREFSKTYKFIKKSQWWSKDQIEKYQIKKLKKLLNHCYINVPYYTKLFNEIGLEPKDILSFKDLKKIPVLNKEIIRKNMDDLKANNYSKNKFEYSTTGGSTGTPLGFYVEKGVTFAKDMAFTKTMLKQGGCNLLDKSVCLTSDNSLWRRQLLGRRLALSSFFMKDDNFKKYYEKILKFKPKYIYAYPSSIYLLAVFIKKNNLNFNHNIKSIFCTGENLNDWQKKLIKEVFKCDIFNWYGHRERVVLASTCEYSEYLHFFPQYGIVELIGEDGKCITKEGEIGEIVATGFLNFTFPFLRYKTGDMGVYTNHECRCGRNYTLMKEIVGRKSDFIVTKSGDLIPFTGFCGVVPESSKNVQEMQFYQEKEGEVVLYIVKGEHFSRLDEKNIKSNLDKRLGSQINLTIKYKDRIPPTDIGKQKFLVQKLDLTQKN